MNILALDTATNACSVALQSGNDIWVEHHVCPRQQSEKILPLIHKVLVQASIELSEVELIACGVGPGAFMGCRLAVSVAQGLAFAHNLKVVPFSTLRILAQTAYMKYQSEAVVSAWDARMGQVYVGAYTINQQGIMVEAVADSVSNPSCWQLPPGAWSAAGNGWQVYEPQFSSELLSSLNGCYSSLYPEARALIQLAQFSTSEQHLFPRHLKPIYLRSPITG